ncbi:peptidoglycan D,D-transpeptidase FtsI family protein [Nocardioides sp. GCM10027113]|uniref:peptidoglycan D,D-transpeptidase FtsI family protein n=1 Tax=unclassified Nocardioides TaxID=2615069 RepID=UPI003610BD3D
MRPTRPRGSLRGSPMLRLRLAFVVIAMVLSVFGARLVQLQGVDPNAYAEMAAAEGTVEVDLPAQRGDILDRHGEPFAASVDGLMVVADPLLTAEKAPEIGKFLANRLDVDYVTILPLLREEGSRFEYIARRVPSTLATDVVREAASLGYAGISTRRDPVRDYPAGDVGANLVGFLGTDEALGGFERTFDAQLAGTDGSARYAVGGGNRIPLGESTVEAPVDGADLRTTLDLDLQWFAQRVLRQTVEDARGDSGFAVVMHTETGEVLALADHPTFDASQPLLSPEEDLGSRAMSDVFEPGSVAKALTVAGLLDSGEVTPRTRVVVPSELRKDGRVIGDWFDHGTLRLTLTGVLAKSSNIGTVRAAERFAKGELRRYFAAFGLGRRTGVGVRGETPGILPATSLWSSLVHDRAAFGQSMSVNALQMAAAINAIANGGVRVSPSLVRGSATTDAGKVVGTDTATTRRVVSEQAARQTALMMERVIDPEAGVAPGAAVPGYRVAGKTGTAQRVGAECGCYDGTFTVSFAGFAPADDPEFTVYVVVQNPRNGGGGGSVAGPAFSKIMGFALRRYQVPPTGTKPSTLPVEW